ncbi:transposon Tf2-6 polyprotein [Nephila pilipes]|uniref:Transposon Tf2-6 polyprotein n=1 Tax=Nephila pilipes TaxID=299642 RepID=A0A8X6IZX3_NEPPI|nr:transposon Tf2-6 polyprotein [Nephila pilipes]
MEVIPIENITSETITKAFYASWICRFGVLYTVITDRGNQFRSELFRSLGIICGIKRQTTTSYHSQSNGKIERQHRTLKAAIRAHDSIKWSENLPTILLGIRASLREDTNCSIAEMVYGKSLKLPGEFLQEPKTKLEPDTFTSELRKQMEKLKPIKNRCKRKQKIFFHKDLKLCSHVFVRMDRVKKALESPYEGPFPVVARNDKYYTLKIKGKDSNVSVDRLKQAYLLDSGEDDFRNLTSKEKENTQLNGDDNVKMEYTKFKTSRSGRRITFPARYGDYVNI